MAERGADAAAAARRVLELEDRKAGMSYRDIAAKHGVSVAQVWRDIRRELRALARLSHDKATELRELESERLDRATETVMAILESTKPAVLETPAVLDRNGAPIQDFSAADIALKAVDRLVKLSERRADLYGLDAPSKVAATDAAGNDKDVVVRVEYAESDKLTFTGTPSRPETDTSGTETV